MRDDLTIALILEGEEEIAAVLACLDAASDGLRLNDMYPTYLPRAFRRVGIGWEPHIHDDEWLRIVLGGVWEALFQEVESHNVRA